MSSDGDVLRPGGNENTRKAEDDMIKLQTEFRELHENVQRLIGQIKLNGKILLYLQYNFKLNYNGNKKIN